MILLVSPPTSLSWNRRSSSANQSDRTCWQWSYFGIAFTMEFILAAEKYIYKIYKIFSKRFFFFFFKFCDPVFRSLEPASTALQPNVRGEFLSLSLWYHDTLNLFLGSFLSFLRKRIYCPFYFLFLFIFRMPVL